jgi:hypothetical protein
MNITDLKRELWQAWQQAGVSRFQAQGMFRRYEEIGDVPAWIANCLRQNYSFFEYRQRLKIQGALRRYHRERFKHHEAIS